MDFIDINNRPMLFDFNEYYVTENSSFHRYGILPIDLLKNYKEYNMGKNVFRLNTFFRLK